MNRPIVILTVPYNMIRFASIIITFLFIMSNFDTANVYADSPIQKVEIAPLTGGVSFNTVTTSSVLGWVTASSVLFRGRKEVMIINSSTTENAYLTGVSGSSATGILYPRESVIFKAGSNLNIYVSSNSSVPIEVEVWEIR